MVHKGDMQIFAKMLRNIEEVHGSVEFKAPLVVAPPTYNIVDELKAEGDWDMLQNTPASSSTTPTRRALPAPATRTCCIWSALAAISAWATRRRRPRATP